MEETLAAMEAMGAMGAMTTAATLDPRHLVAHTTT